MQYLFSIVMAVYNVELYLREAVDSLIAQDIGFDKIQLILVDDGSADGSGAICDEYAARYPDNVVVIHKENGGVSSARNAGLARVQGRYVNFMDSDDKLTANTLSLVYSFFEAHYDETDVVSIPFVFFDGKTGEHILNYKFQSGARVIDLKTEWDAAQLSSSSAFIKREAVGDLAFDVRLHYMEDAKFMHMILCKKETLGVMPQGRYMYRDRSAGMHSARQGAVKDKRWYIPKLHFYYEETIRYFLSQFSHLPKFVQFVMMYDIQWIVEMPALPQGVLTKDEEAEYLRGLYALLPSIDDDVILAQRNIKIERKLFLLKKKYGCMPELRFTENDAALCYGGQPIRTLGSRQPRIDFIRMAPDSLSVEGRFTVFPLPETTSPVIAAFNSEPLSCQVFEDSGTLLALGEVILNAYRFRIDIPLTPDVAEGDLRIGTEACGRAIWAERYTFGPFSGLSEWYRSSYYIRGGWCVQNRGGLSFSKVRRLEAPKRELRFLWELATARKHRARRAVLNRLAYRFLRLFKRRPLWLISDRENRAGDNGEAFFRYMASEHPEVDARFILLKGSPDYKNLAQIGRMVPADSRRRKLLSLVCDYQISSQAGRSVYNPYTPKDAPYRDILAGRRFVFLQHGITQNNLSDWLKRPNQNIFGIIAAAKPEYESFLAPDYQYSQKTVWLTGFPRFDRLVSDAELRQITIMPTWRRYLMGTLDTQTDVWTLAPGFTDSDYYSFYNSLINSDRLLEAAKKWGYHIAFLPHPNLQPYIALFERKKEVLFLGPETLYRSVYQKSALVVTDYSSAVFDFAYLRHPVLYAQFDKDHFFSGEHTFSKGYFDYERDGFGEVEYDLEHTVDRIIEYMENGCQMKDEYRARADRFFAFNDRNNCRRVYEKLMEAGAAAEN